MLGLYGCGGGGSTQDVKNPNRTLMLTSASTSTFPNGSFPKAMVVAKNELWVTNQYSKLVVASADLDTMPDTDGDQHPDLCEFLKNSDPDDAGSTPPPLGADPTPAGNCGDIAFSRVTVLDAGTLAVLGQVDVPREANYIASDGENIYVTHAREGWLTKIDRAARKILTTKRIDTSGLGPLNEIVYDTTRDSLYTLVSTIDTGKPKSLSQFISISNVSAVGKNGTFTTTKLEIPPAQNLTRRVPALALNETEGKVYVAAFDQKRIYQIDVTLPTPDFAKEVSSIKGSRADIKDVVGDDAKITLDTDMIPLSAATALKFKDKTFNFDPTFKNTDTAGTSTLQAHVAVLLDTNGDGTDDRTYHGVLDLEKGELTFYDFVTTSSGKTTVEDADKIREPVQYKGERILAKDYTIEGTLIVTFNKDLEAPAGLQLFQHGGDNYLGVLYSEVDKLSLVKIAPGTSLSTASRFGVLTATGDFPQDMGVFDGYPSANGARVYVTNRNDNTLVSYDVDFTQTASSTLAIQELQRDAFGDRPWELLTAGGDARRFFMTLHGANTVALFENVR